MQHLVPLEAVGDLAPWHKELDTKFAKPQFIKTLPSLAQRLEEGEGTRGISAAQVRMAALRERVKTKTAGAVHSSQ